MNISEYEKALNDVDKVIAGTVAEFNTAINLLRKQAPELVRIRLVLAFMFAEMTCVNFDKFYNINLPPKELMKKWFDEYCLNTKNDVYKKQPYFNKIDTEYLYQLRCSLIHAFALPEPEKNKNIAVMFMDKGDAPQRAKEIGAKFTKAGHVPVFISPDSMTALILGGAIMLHKEIFVDGSEATQKNLEGLKRMLNEFQRRGACSISLDQ